MEVYTVGTVDCATGIGTGHTNNVITFYRRMTNPLKGESSVSDFYAFSEKGPEEMLNSLQCTTPKTLVQRGGGSDLKPGLRVVVPKRNDSDKTTTTVPIVVSGLRGTLFSVVPKSTSDVTVHHYHLRPVRHPRS